MAKKRKAKTGTARSRARSDLQDHIKALERHTLALDTHTAALLAPSVEKCVLDNLGRAKADLEKPFSEIFVGIARPIQVIIAQCGQCFPLNPEGVRKKIDAYEEKTKKKVNTIGSFIRAIGA